MPSTDDRLPSLGMLRDLTDRYVLAQMLASDELTRAEISGHTGISKPTVSESVRRLTASGLLEEAGPQIGKRGPAGTYLRLRADVGVALAVSVGPDGVVVLVHDVRGRELHRVTRAVKAPVRAARLSGVVLDAVTAAVQSAGAPVLGCAVSLAGPVDQQTGRLVRLSYSPFVLGELSPRELIGPLVGGLVVDNDVNWAAVAEHHEGAAVDLAHFFYCYLGPGIGGALMANGEVRHGGRGLAGELAHVLTQGPGGRAMTLVDSLDAWELLRPRSHAVDLIAMERVLTGTTAAERRRRESVMNAIAGALCSVTAVLNPQAVLIGGPWAGIGGLDQRVGELVGDRSAVEVEVRSAALAAEAPLIGTRIRAVELAQAALTREG